MDNRRPWHRYSLIYHTLRSRGPYTESTYLYPQFSTSDLLAQSMPKQRPFVAYTLEDAKRIVWRLIQRTNCHMVLCNQRLHPFIQPASLLFPFQQTEGKRNGSSRIV